MRALALMWGLLSLLVVAIAGTAVTLEFATKSVIAEVAAVVARFVSLIVVLEE